MVFILSSDGRDKDVVEAFAKYREYIESIKSKISSSVYQLAISDWFYNFYDHKCPHDAWLENISILEHFKGERNELRKTGIVVKLLGAYHDGYIELKYKNVTSFNLKSFNVKAGHANWRYDEFRLSESGDLIHEIEWSGYKDSANWLIEAEDIEYSWYEK
ncbi:MAG: hypothetical protein L3J46_00900 [Kangiellaceae bacterium]|nr:hypothetical protein [Kangiellaceae bacterium]